MPIEDYTVKEIINSFTPQYSTRTDIDMRIDMADDLTGSEFGKVYNLAVAYKVMHWYEQEDIGDAEVDGGGDLVDSGSGVGGSILSEREGDLSQTRSRFKTTNGKSAGYEDLSTTRWGLKLIALIEGNIVPFRNRATHPSGITYLQC